MRIIRTHQIFIALFLLLGLCHFNKAEASETKQINIVASFYPVYIMAKNVARDVPGVSVENLTPPLTGCLHDYMLTPNDMKNLVRAHVFAANGAGMESFLDKIVAQYPKVKIIRLSDGIALIKSDGYEGENPHVWVSLSDAIAEVKNLGQGMEEFDPTHQDLYKKNTADYVARLEKLRDKMHAELAPYKGKAIITFHEAFAYFSREFGLKTVAVVEREPGSQPSAKELAQTIELVKKNGIPALFSEPQYPAAAAETIAKETGAKVYVLDPAVTGPDDFDAYLNIMENNLKVLKEAFKN